MLGSRFARLATSPAAATLSSVRATKVVVSSLAGAYLISYAMECKNDVIFFTKK
jgi:hypothetical protein